jgi:hypothetical protein
MHNIIVSTDMRTAAAKTWVTEFKEASSLLSAIMSIIHPELYKAARTVLIGLGDQEDLLPALQKWASVFNGVQVIGNRDTLIHRDYNSRCEWYDILASIGPYESAKCYLPTIRVRLSYGLGTIVGIGGKLLPHEVMFGDGERICYAYFMRSNVHERMQVQNCGWSTIDHVANLFS